MAKKEATLSSSPVNKESLSRRDFLRGTVIAFLGLAASACNPKPPESKTIKEVELPLPNVIFPTSEADTEYPGFVGVVLETSPTIITDPENNKWNDQNYYYLKNNITGKNNNTKITGAFYIAAESKSTGKLQVRHYVTATLNGESVLYTDTNSSGTITALKLHQVFIPGDNSGAIHYGDEQGNLYLQVTKTGSNPETIVVSALLHPIKLKDFDTQNASGKYYPISRSADNLPTPTPIPESTATATPTSTPEPTPTPVPETSRLLTDANATVAYENLGEKLSLQIADGSAQLTALLPALQQAMGESVALTAENTRLFSLTFNGQEGNNTIPVAAITQEGKVKYYLIAEAPNGLSDDSFTPLTPANLESAAVKHLVAINRLYDFSLPADMSPLWSVTGKGDCWVVADAENITRVYLPPDFAALHPELPPYVEAPKATDDAVKYFLEANGIDPANLTYRLNPDNNALEAVDEKGSVWLRRLDLIEKVNVYDQAKSKWNEETREFHTWVITPGNPVDVAQTWDTQEPNFRLISPDCDGATAAQMLDLMSRSISTLPNLNCIKNVKGVDTWLSEGDAELRIHELEPLTVLDDVPVWAIRYSGVDAVDDEPIFCTLVSLGIDNNGVEQRALLKLKPCSQLVDEFKRRDTRHRVGINETEATQELGKSNTNYSIRLWAMYLYEPLPEASIKLVGSDIAALLNKTWSLPYVYTNGSIWALTMPSDTGHGAINPSLNDVWNCVSGKKTQYGDTNIVPLVTSWVNGSVLIGAPQFKSA